MLTRIDQTNAEYFLQDIERGLSAPLAAEQRTGVLALFADVVRVKYNAFF